MKIKFFVALALFSFLILPAGHAVEQFSADPLLTQSADPFLNYFQAVVTQSGDLVLKPGPVFTEGGDYEGMQLPYLKSYSEVISYPRWALRQGWQGNFSIAIEILTNGKVGRYAVTHSTGHKVLDNAATEAVRTWRFQPAMKNGKLIVTCIQIPVRFQIQD